LKFDESPFPFKGRARVGMGFYGSKKEVNQLLQPIPIPTFPLKGKELLSVLRIKLATMSLRKYSLNA
jgi:hypothetical protein